MRQKEYKKFKNQNEASVTQHIVSMKQEQNVTFLKDQGTKGCLRNLKST